MKTTSGSLLVGLLWCVALLSLLVIGVLHTATIDLRIVKNYGDVVQAHYLALAGIEKAKALLYQDAINRRRSSRNHSGELYDAPVDFKDIKLGRGQFRVFHQGRREEGGGILYGVSDEESRLNLNTASDAELAKLPEMTPELVAAVIDWRDEDNTVTTGGAEADYYASLQPPYLPRNGPFQTVRELLMVRGVTRELFGGEDANLNGILDPEEDDGSESYPPDNHDGVLDAGWSGLLTVDSSVRNVNAAGQARANLQSADEATLTAVKGISAEIARGIIARRGQNRFESLADLLDVTAAAQPGQFQPPQGNAPGDSAAPAATGEGPRGSPAPGNSVVSSGGPKLVSEDLLSDIADDLTTDDGQEQAGAVNANTASPTVLACLPGLTPELAQAIVAYRQSSGFFPNVAALLKVPGINRDIFKQFASRVSARSETFRILSEGQISSTGAQKRIQVIVRVGTSEIETLSWREDL